MRNCVPLIRARKRMTVTLPSLRSASSLPPSPITNNIYSSTVLAVDWKFELQWYRKGNHDPALAKQAEDLFLPSPTREFQTNLDWRWVLPLHLRPPTSRARTTRQPRPSPPAVPKRPPCPKPMRKEKVSGWSQSRSLVPGSRTCLSAESVVSDWRRRQRSSHNQSQSFGVSNVIDTTVCFALFFKMQRLVVHPRVFVARHRSRSHRDYSRAARVARSPRSRLSASSTFTCSSSQGQNDTPTTIGRSLAIVAARLFVPCCDDRGDVQRTPSSCSMSTLHKTQE